MIFINMKRSLNEFNSEKELIKFFENPLIQKQIQLVSINTKKSVSTEILKMILINYISFIDCESIKIDWTKKNGFSNFNILFENY